MSRRARFSALLGLAIVAIVFFYLSQFQGDLRKWTSGGTLVDVETPVELETTTQTAVDDEVTTTSPLCSEAGCFKGTWKPRTPPLSSIEEVKPYQGCASTARLRGASLEKANAKRLLDIMNWVWTPYRGVLAEWDAEEFVLRLLRSPGGLISVGDETSKDHLDALVVSLQQGGIPLHRLSQSTSRFMHQYALTPDTPMTQSLADRSKIPPSRLKRPILTLVEDSLLINDVDLKIISERLGTDKSENWTTELPRVQRWPVIVEQMSSTVDDEGNSVPEDTILLLNTGIHWSRFELSLLKSRNNPAIEQNYLTEAYRQMLRVISEQLKPISRLSVYYRATTPGHPKCYARPSPYKSPRMAETMEKNVVGRLLQGVSTEEGRQEKRKWDWDLFSVHNDLWRRAIVRLEQERKQALARPYPYTKVYAKWHYLDVWNQALQRPDAHRDPLADCLSWCAPVLFDQWTRHLHHVLQLKVEPYEPQPPNGAES